MTVAAQREAGIPGATMAALLLAVFAVSVGYGVVLPSLPYMVERLLGAGAEATQVSRQTGFLAGAYTLALFLFAPVWGRLSDRRGRRGTLLVGLVGCGVTMLVFAFVESLAGAYAERFLSGTFAAAVTPVASAAIGDFSTTEQGRARRLAFVSMAGIAGFLLGPMLNVFVTRSVASFFGIIVPIGSVAIPLAATALLVLLVSVAVALAVPNRAGPSLLQTAMDHSASKTDWVVPKLHALTFIVSAGIGVFEVGLALRGTQELGLAPSQIALMFAVCSLVMLMMQAVVFSPGVKIDTTRWLIAPALFVLAAGLLLVPWVSSYPLMLVVIGVVAASAGILSPTLTYWISARAGSAQGWELGKQAAAATLGVTLGSVAGGLLFNVAALSGTSFVLTAALTAVGFLLSLRLPGSLVPHKPEQRPLAREAQ